jgi:heme/copper-type cytochrome/quinol oxidase subunit 4
MKTIINLILGLGTAIILSSLILLGIKAFHPEPIGPDYNNFAPKSVPAMYVNCGTDVKCAAQQTRYNEEQIAQQEKFEKENRIYQDKLKVYNKDVFIIANIVGIIIFITGFLLLFYTAIASQSVPVGIMLAGLYGIIYGYARGWNSTNDQLKFFIGLVIAAIVIGGSIWLMQKFYKKIS